MNQPPFLSSTIASVADSSALRVLRYGYRVPMLLWHLLVDLPLVLLAITPLTASIRMRGGEPLDHRLIRAWSAGLMRVFGFRLRRSGVPMNGATMFVAKKEISRWPLIGWLASRGETIYHQRGSQESLGGVLHEMLARLRGGRAVGVFPEGRTRNGREVGPFHARIFLAAVEAGVAVQPVALRYGDHAAAQTVVAFRERESFVGNFLRLLGEPARSAEVAFLEPIAPGDAIGRRRLAEVARERIVAAMHADRTGDGAA